jgi:plasmid stability protein
MKKNTLTIRGLDDKVIEQLKARARTRQRSLEAELREILIQASSQPRSSTPWPRPIASPP